MNLTQEQKFKFRLRYEQEQQQQPATTPTEMAAPEEPGLFGRSFDTAKEAVGDAFGNLYGGEGNPYNDGKKTDIPVIGPAIDWVSRSRESGGMLGEAAADIVGDIAGSAYEMAGSPFKEEGTEAINAVMDSAPVQAAGEVLGAVTEANPNASKYIGDSMSLASLVSPTKTPRVNLKVGNYMAKKEAARAATTRRDGVKWLLEPDKPDWNDFDIEGKGAFKTTKWSPTDYEKSVIEEVTALPKVKPKGSFAVNLKAVQTEIKDRAAKLVDDITKHGNPVKATTVYRQVDDALKEMAKSPVLVGDAETSARRIYETFRQRVQQAAKESGNGTVEPNLLLQIRKDLDKELNFKKMAGGSRAAKEEAGNEIRKRLNQMVQDATPDVDVLGSLEGQSKLFDAQALLKQRFAQEADGPIRQFIEGFERASGLKHPTTPAAATMTATHLPTAAMTLLGAVAYGTGAKVKEKTLAAIRTAIQAPEYGLQAAEKAAIISLIDQYREMQKEEEQ